MDKIQTQPMRRMVEDCEIKVRQDDDTQMLSFPAASETPVDRWFGREVLSHRGGAVRLERAQQGAMPLLWNHNGDDPVGVVRGASVKQKRLMVDAELFDTERGREVATMIDSGLRNVSVGYRLHEMVLQERAEDGETYLATDWEPYEVSIVSVPADASVGIGRAPSEVVTTRIISTGGK
jgi:HK97 family phage prohead protease